MGITNSAGVVPGVGVEVLLGTGVGDDAGVESGVVNPGDVILCAIDWGENATELELIEMMTRIGKVNSTKSMKMRSTNNLKLDVNFDIDADID
jgi:hypothetical protein